MFIWKIMGAGIGAVILFSANVAYAKQSWTCSVFTGPKHFINKALKPWGKNVEKATNGEVRVRFLPVSAAPPPKQIDGIAAGTYDCAFIFHAFTRKRAVGPQFGILPFLSAGSAEHGSIAFWRTWRKHFGQKGEFDDDGIKILSMFQFPGVHFWTAKDKPINSIADMMAGITRAGILNFAGIQFPKSGTFTSKSIMAPSFAWLLSKKKWDALPGNVKRAVTDVSGEKLARAVGLEADKFETISANKLAKAGVKEIKASKSFEAALMKAANPQIDAWIKRAATIGVDGNKVIADFNKIIGDLGS